jgi:anaerobic selenocysteine-containing dehydrogenase
MADVDAPAISPEPAGNGFVYIQPLTRPGHSNVQGNRTCGIDHRPSQEFLDRLAAACGIDPPRDHRLDTVATIQEMHRGTVKVFVCMGGNFVRAAPDTPYTAAGPRRCDLTVHVSTKLNRATS